MPDYTEGTKKEVAEIKFLIHDLRVEKFINEVIHFHVTLDTDLELHGVDQAQIIHGHDLKALKDKAVGLRKAYQDFSNAVKNFSPDRTVLASGRKYVDTIFSACDLVLNPLWGRVDRILAFLPPDCRSAKTRAHYFNCISWIRGVHQRIQQFFGEHSDSGVYQEFDIAAEIEDFTRNVVYGYVMEHSSGRVQIELDRLDSAILRGNVARFRRMYFNLVMNAVDAMANRDVGVLTVGAAIAGDRAILAVADNGSGMPPEKISKLLAEKETLDGELHSLGFVFVRQTVRDFGGDLRIESCLGRGTTITISFPYLQAKEPDRESGKNPLEPPLNRVVLPLKMPPAEKILPTKAAAPLAASESIDSAEARFNCGRILLDDYERSDAQHPGSIFAISVNEAGQVDFFSHARYEKHWDIEHEDLSPMLFEAVVRGRLEQDASAKPQLTLKAPISLVEYFELRDVPEEKRTPDRFVSMVHDEYIRIARIFIETGLPPQTPVLLDRLEKFFPGIHRLNLEPFSLQLLARQT